MSYISRLNQNDFFEIVGKIESQVPETMLEFPMEYYFGPGFIFVYKQLSQKIYKTFVQISINNTALYKGQLVTVDEILTDLRTNHNAVELIEPIDYIEILLKHNHDDHAHAGIEPNDVFNIIPGVKGFQGEIEETNEPTGTVEFE